MVTKKTRIYINNNIEFTHLRCFRPGHTLNTHSTKQYNKIIGMGTANQSFQLNGNFISSKFRKNIVFFSHSFRRKFCLVFIAKIRIVFAFFRQIHFRKKVCKKQTSQEEMVKFTKFVLPRSSQEYNLILFFKISLTYFNCLRGREESKEEKKGNKFNHYKLK